jgi:uncharacterized protein (DUF2141 family)
MKRISILILLLSFSAVNISAEAKGDIVVVLHNIRSEQGTLRVALFNQAQGFPDRPEKALSVKWVNLKNDVVKAVFADCTYGEYAIGVFHDENSNGEFDFNWIGMPVEGYGASNDAEGFFGPPGFKDASFLLQADILILHIKVKY